MAWRAWLRAIDPPIYIVGLFPPLVGAAATLSSPHPLPFALWGWPLLGFLLLLGATNLANDAFDAATPADRVKRHSLARLASVPSLHVVASCLVLLAGVAGLVVWLRHPSWVIPAFSALGLVLLLAYHAPPFRLSHRGWGELVTFMAFGPVPVWATASLGDGTVPASAIVPGLLVGLAATLVLVHHNVASRIDDGVGGKRTIAVRLGAGRARVMEGALEATLSLGIAAWMGANLLSGVVFVILASLAAATHWALVHRAAGIRAASLGLYTAASCAILAHLTVS